MRRLAYLVVLLFLGSMWLFNDGLVVEAAGEQYSLTVSPDRTQESNTPGVTLVLSVDDAQYPETYEFSWTVTDPSGATKGATTSTIVNQPSFSVSVVYPRDFATGAKVNYVGTYLVNVTQTTPCGNPCNPILNVADGSFEAGLTDSVAYQRTLPVSIRARGYNPGDNITINVAQGVISALGFPRWQLADANGEVAQLWQIPPDTSTGTYTATLTGTITVPKNPPDTQSFIVYPAEISIPQITVSKDSLQRAEIVKIEFAAVYPGGGTVTTGGAGVRITEPDGVTFHQITASYLPSQGVFRTVYSIPLSSQTGVWVASLEEDSFDDSYGNTGPIGIRVRGFNVETAYFVVTVVVGNKTYVPGDIISVWAEITAPGGTSFTDGGAEAYFSISRQPIRQLTMSYDQSQSKWFTSYQVNATNPVGLWLIEVRAFDAYGNSGKGSTSSFISATPENTASLASYWYIFLVPPIALGLFFLKRKRVFHRQLKIDVKAIEREAEMITSQEFFRSVHDQLKESKKQQASSKG